MVGCLSRRFVLAAACLLGTTTAASAESGMSGGLVVCIGAEALEGVANDWEEPGCVIHCLETSDDEVSRLRRRIQAAGCYGKVSVAQFDGERLPYINNLVNTIVIRDARCRIPAEEVQRVLAPYGTAIAPEGAACLPQPVAQMDEGLVKYAKPYPSNIDEWPQYLHGADNNCVAQDTVVGPPRHVQWISGPAWTRAHIGAATMSSMVSSLVAVCSPSKTPRPPKTPCSRPNGN